MRTRAMILLRPEVLDRLRRAGAYLTQPSFLAISRVFAGDARNSFRQLFQQT